MEMDRGTFGWIVNYARRNFWRVHTWYDLDDLVQDGCLTYWRIVRKYVDVKDRRHLMSLFQRSFINHVADLSNRCTLQRYEVPFTSYAWSLKNEDEPVGIHLKDVFNDMTKAEPEQATFSVLLDQATKPIEAVLAIFESETQLKKMRAPYRRYRSGYRETLNDRLQRLIKSSSGPLWFWAEGLCQSPDSPSISALVQEHFGT